MTTENFTKAETRSSLLTAPTTVRSPLTVNTNALVVAPDGVTSGTITVGGGTNGETVDISFDGPLYVDAIRKTFDVVGDATFTFGPCPTGQCWSKPVGVTFTCSNNRNAPVSATVKFGPA